MSCLWILHMGIKILGRGVRYRGNALYAEHCAVGSQSYISDSLRAFTEEKCISREPVAWFSEVLLIQMTKFRYLEGTALWIHLRNLTVTP